MFGKKKNKDQTVIKQKTTIKEKYTVPAEQVRQQIRHGTSLLGGSGIQYSQTQQFPTQTSLVQSGMQQSGMQQSGMQQSGMQQSGMQPVYTQQGVTTTSNIPYTQGTPDPYLTNLPGDQQYGSLGSTLGPHAKGTIETKVERNITRSFGSHVEPTMVSNVMSPNTGGYVTTVPVGTTGYNTSTMPVGTTGYNTSTMPVGTTGYNTSTMPVGTTGLQRNRASSSSSSSSQGRKNKMRTGMGTNISPTKRVETLNPIPTSYGQTQYTSNVPYQQGNIQTGYGPTTTSYDQTLYATNPIESTLYRSSMQRKGPILGKNLYGETGYASSGYTIQQPFPGQTVYVQEDPAKISERTKSKFFGPVM